MRTCSFNRSSCIIGPSMANMHTSSYWDMLTFHKSQVENDVQLDTPALRAASLQQNIERGTMSI